MKKKQRHAPRRAARGQETSKKNSPKGDSLKTKRRVDHANILVLSHAVEIT